MNGLLAGFAKASAGNGARRQLWPWAALAIFSLAVAGIFSLLLPISRIPGIEKVASWLPGYFGKALVFHVIFAFIVSFLAVFGGLLHLACLKISEGAPRFYMTGQAAAIGAMIASVLLLVSAFLGRGEASLNNYVPVIIDPIYYAGVLILALSIGLSALCLLLDLWGRPVPKDPFCFGLVCAAAVYLLALVCGGLAFWHLRGAEVSHAFNEELFWGGGHVLQFVNVALLLVSWQVLGRLVLGGNSMADGVFRIAFLLLLLPALPAVFFYFAYEPFSAGQTMAFTNLQYALALPSLLMAASLAALLRRASLRWKDPAFLALALSPLLFGAGGFLGLFVDGADTRTPAHYHGVLTGIQLAFMGLFYSLFLPLLGRIVKPGKALWIQFYLYGIGQFIACIGLFLAGGHGAPRKTAGAEQGLEHAAAVFGMRLNGFGALFAVVGGVMFIWMVGASLLRKPSA